MVETRDQCAVCKELLIRMQTENKILSELVDRAHEQNRWLLREICHLQETVDKMRQKDGR